MRTKTNQGSDTGSTGGHAQGASSATTGKGKGRGRKKKQRSSAARRSASGQASGSRRAPRGAHRQSQPKQGAQKLRSLRVLFSEELHGLLDFYGQVRAALEAVEDEAEHPALREACGILGEDTDHHRSRLQRLGEALVGQTNRKSRPAAAIVSEVQKELRKQHRWPARDMVIVVGLQKLLHHGIAVIGSLRAWAEHLDRREAMRPLERALDDSKLADRHFTRIAERVIVDAAERRRGSAAGRHDGDGDGDGHTQQDSMERFQPIGGSRRSTVRDRTAGERGSESESEH